MIAWLACYLTDCHAVGTPVVSVLMLVAFIGVAVALIGVAVDMVRGR